MNTQKMTTAQALVKFLDNQYVEHDGEVTKFVEGIFTVFGHGIVVGLGQALDENPGDLRVYQGRNEQGMAHVAAGFSKATNRKRILACASSIGPGAANMVTAAACATVNNVPLLLFAGDTYATRQPDPVLQQLEQTHNPNITTNDAFKPVCKYWDRIVRPEQLMSTMIQAMRVLTDPADTGAVCIALSQDAEGESYDYPTSFFEKRVHRIRRAVPTPEDFHDLVSLVSQSKKPIVVCGGGVRYSEAGEALEQFCEQFGIPFGETQAGKSACRSSHPYNLGGIGVTGNLAANVIAAEADLVLAVGTRLTDFTTGSKQLFQNPEVKLVSINVSPFHAYKMDATPIIADAKIALQWLTHALEQAGYHSGYTHEVRKAKADWDDEMERLSNYIYDDAFEPIVKARNPVTIDEFVALTGGTITQTAALALIRKHIESDAIAVGASGSLPGCMQRMWTTDARDSYLMEYGYSCMGYEIAATLGAKLAKPEVQAYSMVGDGSFQMLHSELTTALQEGAKINVLLFDNAGFGCINNLQMNSGIGNLATEFRYRDGDGKLNGALIPVDYAKVCEGYGLKTYTAKTLAELEAALEDAKKQTVSTLIDIKVLPKTMTDGYQSWWNVGLASVSGIEAEQKAYAELLQNRDKARRY